VVREALHHSLDEVRRSLDPDQKENYADWFENWAERLNGSGSIVVDSLSNVADLLASNALSSDQTEIQLILDQLFRNMMERLDGEARAMRSGGRSGDLSITGAHSFRLVPDELLGILTHQLPAALDARFRNLVALPEHRRAWIAVEQSFQDYVRSSLAEIIANSKRIEEQSKRILQIRREPTPTRPG
jgi:hypothetical protein